MPIYFIIKSYEDWVWKLNKKTGLFLLHTGHQNCLDQSLLNNPKKRNFEEMKKLPGDIIILNRCTINDNHVIYGSQNNEHDGQNILSFWTIFCPFTLPTTRKIKILKKWYGCWDIERHRHNFLSFCTIFCPCTPLTTPKIKTRKKKCLKTFIILHIYTINDNHMMYGSWDMKHDR